MSYHQANTAERQNILRRVRDWLTRLDAAVHFTPNDHVNAELTDLRERLSRLEERRSVNQDVD